MLCLFLPAKNNIGRDTTGLAFTVEGHLLIGEQPISTSRVMWELDPVAMTADEAVRRQDPEQRSALEEAREFLAEQLAGPVPATALKKTAHATDNAWITVRAVIERILPHLGRVIEALDRAHASRAPPTA